MSVIKDVDLSDEGKKKLINGINTFADAVSATIGYRGRTVLIETAGSLVQSTKDGYSVGNAIFLEDPTESLGCEFLKEACRRTHAIAGDSTSLTALLSQALVKYSHELVDQGESPIDVKIKMEKSRDLVLSYLKEKSILLNDELMFKVAMTSSNHDEEVATIIAKAFSEAGQYGIVTHTRSESGKTYLDTIEGTLCESGYSTELFINNHVERTANYNNPLVLVSDVELQNANQIIPFFEAALTAGNKRSLVVISDVKFDVANVILKNFLEKKIDIVIVTPPNFGGKRKDYLSDLALVCGTNLLSATSGVSFVGRAHEFLGECQSINVGKNDTIIVPSPNVPRERVESKIVELYEIISKSENDLEKAYLEDRVAKLNGKISIIKVGANIESELNEKIDRVDDAVRAVRTAKDGGIVAGGGVLLYNASIDVEVDEATKKALTRPIEKILENAGKTLLDINWGSFKHTSLSEDFIGYDVKDYKICNMIEAGIVDTAKAIGTAYENAVSVAGTVLMTKPIITYKR